MCRQKNKPAQVNEMEAAIDEPLYVGILEVVDEIKVDSPEEWWVNSKVNFKIGSLKLTLD